MNVRQATDHDLPAILSLLEEAQLPTTDLGGASPVRFWVTESRGAITGVVGLERHDDAALLRSLAVHPTARGRGLGIGLVEHLEAAAHAAGISRLVLLTQTAKDFFLARGYHVIARDDAPASLRSSAEFKSLCPASAVCMARTLRSEVEAGAGR